MALCQENITPMVSGARPSPTFFGHYGTATYGPASQPHNVNNGAVGHGQYGQEHAHYAQFQVSPIPGVGPYPDLSGQAQQPQNDGAGSHPTHGQWPSAAYPGAPPPRPAHVALDEWSQSYLFPSAATGATSTTLHHQSPYSYHYRTSQGGLDDYGGHTPGVDSSPSTDSNSPSGGVGGHGTGGTGTKQLRPPFEWMKPAHTQPAPGKTRTKDKYRVVYSDHQRLELEKEFHFSRYITIRRKAEIAQQLALSERQVKIWFQNRRAKERKQNKKREEAMRNGTGVPKLEPLDSPPPITASHHPHSHAHSPNMGMGMGQHHHHQQQQQQQQQQQHHAMSMPTVPGEGGLANPQLHSPVPSSHHYAPQRISPLPNQGVGPHDNLPQTATPTGPPIQTSVSVNCSTIPHRSQNVPTPLYDKKPDMA